MKATIEFDLPEEQEEFETACDGLSVTCRVSDTL